MTNGDEVNGSSEATAQPVRSPSVVRGHKKAALMKAIGGLRKSVSERDINATQAQLSKLKLVFNDFDAAHGAYCDTLTELTDIAQSEAY